MKQILWFIKTYFTFVILFGFQKPFFMILEKASATQPIDNIWSEMPTVIVVWLITRPLYGWLPHRTTGFVAHRNDLVS